jgi:hypothetical protein
MFAAVLFILVCLVSPFIPSTLAPFLSLSIIILIAAIVMRTIFAPDHRRVFAAGFLVPSCIYIATVFAVGDFTFHHVGSRLPTTHFMQRFVQPPVSNPPKIQIVGPEARLRQAHGRAFIPLGHLLIAVALGYCGGAYARQLRRTTSSAHSTPSGANATA